MYGDAVTQWLSNDPDGWDVAMVSDWIARLRQAGPPTDAMKVWEDDDFYLARVSRSEVICRYLVVDYERLIILKDLERRPDRHPGGRSHPRLPAAGWNEPPCLLTAGQAMTLDDGRTPPPPPSTRAARWPWGPGRRDGCGTLP